MQTAHYVRIYSDESGESHFDDQVLELPPVNYAPPAAPLNFVRIGRAEDWGLLGVAPDWAGDVPHPSPRRQLFCVAAGEFEVTASDGTRRTLKPGGVLLLEDTFGKGHSTRIIGDHEGLLVAVGLQQ